MHATSETVAVAVVVGKVLHCDPILKMRQTLLRGVALVIRGRRFLSSGKIQITDPWLSWIGRASGLQPGATKRLDPSEA